MVSKRESVGHEIRKAAGLTPRRGVQATAETLDIVWSHWRELSLWSR